MRVPALSLLIGSDAGSFLVHGHPATWAYEDTGEHGLQSMPTRSYCGAPHFLLEWTQAGGSLLGLTSSRTVTRGGHWLPARVAPGQLVPRTPTAVAAGQDPQLHAALAWVRRI